MTDTAASRGAAECRTFGHRWAPDGTYCLRCGKGNLPSAFVYVTADGTPIQFVARSEIGIDNMVASANFVDRTPAELEATFEPYDCFHAEIITQEQDPIDPDA